MIFWVAVSPCAGQHRQSHAQGQSVRSCGVKVGSWQSTAGTTASLAEMRFFLPTATAPERRVVEVWSKFALSFIFSIICIGSFQQFPASSHAKFRSSAPLERFIWTGGSKMPWSNPLISSAEAMHQHSHASSLGTVRGKSGSIYACRRICVAIRMPKVFSDQAQTLSHYQLKRL